MRMRAVVLNRHGGPEVLESREIELEPPGPREVRVRIRAVAMNHMDLWVRRGLPNLKLTYPHRLGCDIAGVVDQLGPGARGCQPGQAVMVQPGLSCGVCGECLSGRDNRCRHYRIVGEHVSGGYAEFINVPDTNVLGMPPNLSFVQAAALPLCTITAWQMVFRKGQVAPHHTVLVHAAGSGVSSIAIQLCKLVGARVITTVGSRDKIEKAKALGADDVIVYTEQDFADECKRLTDKRGVDVVLDHVGGEVFEKSMRALAWGGRLVTVGATSGYQPQLDLRHVFYRQLEVLGSTMGSKADLLAALPFIAQQRIVPVVGMTVPLWQAQKAHEALEARKVFGKVVLEVEGEASSP